MDNARTHTVNLLDESCNCLFFVGISRRNQFTSTTTDSSCVEITLKDQSGFKRRRIIHDPITVIEFGVEWVSTAVQEELPRNREPVGVPRPTFPNTLSEGIPQFAFSTLKLKLKTRTRVAIQVVDRPIWQLESSPATWLHDRLPDERDVANLIQPQNKQNIFDVVWNPADCGTGRTGRRHGVGLFQNPIGLVDICGRENLPKFLESKRNKLYRKLAKVKALRIRFEITDQHERFEHQSLLVISL